MDPYDQNASAKFFDTEWMFGQTDGFDVVIGNPPYGRIVSGRDEETVVSRWPKFRATRDAFVAFVLGGLKFNGDHATLSFIMPTAWLSGPSYKALRAALLRKTINEFRPAPWQMMSLNEWSQIPDNQLVLSESGVAMTYTLRENGKRTFASLVEMRRGGLFAGTSLPTEKPSPHLILTLGATFTATT